ncbi:hypothetical protein VTN77DRAFT_3517 [Rasamsonia byssochlamydoides]|uniref:uncharacterized protein n=1 Tax=Rasamsonia byssochlamydoides TaxID=89139 RepID=UPI00374282FA
MAQDEQPSAFTPAQKLEIQQLIQQAVQTALDARGVQNTRDIASPQPSSTSACQSRSSSPLRLSQLQDYGKSSESSVPQIEPWNGEEVGYFHPDLADDNDAAVVVIDNRVHYRDVHVFIDRVRQVAAVRGSDAVKHQLWVCLRGLALSWYSVELSEHQRRSLRLDTLEDGWISALVEQFKLTKNETEKKLKFASYTMADVRAGVSVRGFAQRVFRYTTATGMNSITEQLLAVWSKLDPELRVHIPQPTPTLTTSEFLDQLSSKEGTWKKIARDMPALSVTQADHLPKSFHVKINSIPKLNGWHDYDTWEFLVRSQLNQYGLGDLIDSTVARPKETHRKYAIWDKLSRRISAWLMLQVEAGIITGLLQLDNHPLQYADETMKSIATIVMGGGDPAHRV